MDVLVLPKVFEWVWEHFSQIMRGKEFIDESWHTLILLSMIVQMNVISHNRKLIQGVI